VKAATAGVRAGRWYGWQGGGALAGFGVCAECPSALSARVR
jgi:hypothetical protein